MDAHSLSPLDEIWFKVFNAKRLSSLDQTPDHLTALNNVIWPFYRDLGPMLNRGKTPPLVPEFRAAIMNAFHVPTDHKK